jgi:hypothetical protein
MTTISNGAELSATGVWAETRTSTCIQAVHHWKTTVGKPRRAKKWSPSNCHLFGTFYDIQYRADERDTPLFCFDSDYGIEWGGGTAQVFYKLNSDGGVSFSFDWSCF